MRATVLRYQAECDRIWALTETGRVEPQDQGQAWALADSRSLLAGQGRAVPCTGNDCA
jgi:hypothetical protein